MTQMMRIVRTCQVYAGETKTQSLQERHLLPHEQDTEAAVHIYPCSSVGRAQGFVPGEREVPQRLLAVREGARRSAEDATTPSSQSWFSVVGHRSITLIRKRLLLSESLFRDHPVVSSNGEP
jgi:hypothetical protein